MKTTIDKAGRIVIPKKIREEAGLEPGMELDVWACDGRVEIEPATLPVKLVRRPGGMIVAVPLVDVPNLTHEEVDRTIKALREERGQIHDH